MKEILSLLLSVFNKGYSAQDIFKDLVDLILFPIVYGKDYRRYAYLLDKYTDSFYNEHFLLFTKAADLVQEEMKRTQSDVLGPLLVEWNALTESPPHFVVSTEHSAVFKQMTKDFSNSGVRFLSVCCGSGTSILESIKECRSKGIKPPEHIAIDTDEYYCKMTAINLYYQSTYGAVILGNVLNPVISDMNCEVMVCDITAVYEIIPIDDYFICENLELDDLELFRFEYGQLLHNHYTKAKDLIELEKGAADV